MSVRLMLGDCLERMRELPDGSVDAVVTDPPAGISFMGRDWDHDKGGRTEWVGWLSSRLAECHRIAKPGSRMLCWALPRTSHWTGLAIEDAGWKIEDRVSHLFGTGFPKHKSKLKPACEDWWLAIKPAGHAVDLNIDACRIHSGPSEGGATSNTALGLMNDDGWEPRPRAIDRSMSSGRYPANLVLSHSPYCRRTGTIRIKDRNGRDQPFRHKTLGSLNDDGWKPKAAVRSSSHVDPDGKETVESWECVEGCPVAILDGQSGILRTNPGTARSDHAAGCYGPSRKPGQVLSRGDSGGASRFFYTAKANRADRGDGNSHPTVKSTELMRWLIRLITSPGDAILDPFMGSGSTGKAATHEGRSFVGIERDPGYFAIAERRIAEAEVASSMPFLAGGDA